MHEFDFDINNYKTYDFPILITQALKDLENDKSMFEIDKKAIHEDLEGWNKNFYTCWAVHKWNNWIGYLILDKSDCNECGFTIAEGIGY